MITAFVVTTTGPTFPFSSSLAGRVERLAVSCYTPQSNTCTNKLFSSLSKLFVCSRAKEKLRLEILVQEFEFLLCVVSCLSCVHDVVLI